MKFAILVLFLVIFLCAIVNQANAQTSPTPFDLSSGSYSFTTWLSTSPAGTYPPNMRFHRGPSQDPVLTAEPNADYVDAYGATTGSRMNGLGTDGFAWRNTGTAGTLGAAVLALNATGITNVYVSWTGGTVLVDATTREYRIRLQYRVGTSGPFIDVPGPVEYTTNSTAGHFQNLPPTLLPAEVNNQPVVHVRWKYYYVTGSNTRPQLRVGNILVQTGQLPGDGTGSASVLPDTANGGTTGPIQIIYRRNTQVSVNAIRVLVPPSFDWSRNRNDISYTNMTATDTVVGDTISFTGISFGADSTVITISNITTPDSTSSYPFRVQSKENVFADISPIPRMVVFGAPIPIADVKANDVNGIPLRNGQLVTIEGIVTVANEFGGPSFVQDNSGGIGIFGSSFSTAVNIGDEVKVSGAINPFNGLCELTNPVLHSIVSTGNSVTPVAATCSQLFNDGQGGVEQYEGSLVRVNVVTVVDTLSGLPPGSWNQCGASSGCNYRLLDASGHVDIRIDNNVSFFGSPAPQGTFSVVGVLSQFKTGLPFIGGYQLMPRVPSDLITAGPIIASAPLETNITQTSLTITWNTINAGTSRIRYGTTPSLELGVVAPDDSMRTFHAVGISSLTPATVYYVQAFSVEGADTSASGTIVVSTSSPSASTGEINVYFNRSVNTSVSTGENALGNQDLVAKLVARINNAQRSIDAAVYSMSGTPGNAVAAALVNAKNRGVKVRVICEYDNRNTAAFDNLVFNSVPLIDDRFDPINFGAGLMHNKFFVFDYRGGAPESVWVWTGSWNLTLNQTTTDHQNSIEIQDVALAGAYTLEFNEMWGSGTDVPNAGNSRFGARKQDNTPHHFVINGLLVQSYFSPSDRTTNQIKNTLRKAEHDVAFALFSFTRRDIADTLIARKNAGRRVRGVMDNGSGDEQFTYLQSNNIDVHLEPTGNIFHHKYAIVDGSRSPGQPQWVVTGSHNWSNSAELRNNENTLIVQSSRVANLYLQEFAARYYEAGGTDSILVGVQETGGVATSFSLAQNYPNPFNPSTVIRYSLHANSHVKLVVYNLLGQEVATLVDEVQKPGTHTAEFQPARFASGVYFYRLQAGELHDTKKMIFLK
jgi:phosphatidylserine/phosphatidylglycerophosphate/cardiolipin synthase-like enzyme